jgi:mono/diheme cytochrome c family protein
MVSSASAQDAERGHQIAERWCSACHAVDKNRVNRTEAPSFIGIAAKHRDDQRWMRAWLMVPHPSMPDMSLSRIEIDDVVAYLKTLPQSE